MTSSITVLASDPEADALTYNASFLESWMYWDQAARTLSGMPAPGTIGKTFFVKFWLTTPSGGTDSFLGKINVQVTLGANALPGAVQGPPDGPNPTRGRFALTAPFVPGFGATLSVYDLSGRRVAVVRGRSGTQFVWNGRDAAGRLAAPGLYLYRMEAGEHRRDGKVVVLR